MAKRQKIFIPFLDGLLDCDCHKCRYNCCYYPGILIMNTKEKTSLLRMHPFLRHFFIREKNKTYTIKKYAGCWFLEDGGSCSIQRKFGYSHKPFFCRLDPFYVARCQDEYIVTQGLYWCPMLHLARRKTGISHKQILKNAQEAIGRACMIEEVN